MKLAICGFSELTAEQLYAVLKLRQDVFMCEQQSIYEDIDNADQQALHFCHWQDAQLLAYARLRGNEDKHCYKIERVVLAPEMRGIGAGHALMQQILAYCQQQHQYPHVMLSAQCDALPFYQKLGFAEQGDAYDDGGILHKDMWLNLTPVL